MSERVAQNTVDTGSGGTFMKDGTDQILAELDLLYGHINSALKLQTGPAAPATPMDGELWVDTSSGTNILRRWSASGAAWEQLGESGGFGTGIALDTGLKGYSNGMWLARASATSLTIPATSTVMVNGNLLQNTSATTLSGITSASGDYDIYVERSGLTSNYTLGIAAHPYTAPATRRIIGRAIRAGSDFVSITSLEAGGTTEGSTPPGAIMAYAGASAPTGWLMCDGSSYNNADYAALYAVIGTTYGTGGGATFKVPDLGGKVPVGFKDADATFGTLADDVGADHEHLPAHVHSDAAVSGNSGTIAAQPGPPSPAVIMSLNAGSTGSTGTGAVADTISTLQPSLVLNFIIKT